MKLVPIGGHACASICTLLLMSSIKHPRNEAGAQQTQRQPAADAATTATVRRQQLDALLSILPRDLESVLVAQPRERQRREAPGRPIVETRIVNGRAVQVVVDSSSGERLPYYGPFDESALLFTPALLDNVDSGGPASRWLSRNLSLAVAGGRNFHDQIAERRGWYDACLLMQFKDGLAPEALKLFRRFGRNEPASDAIIIATQRRWKDATLRLYVREAAAGTIVVATDLALLNDIRRSKDVVGTRPWIYGLPEMLHSGFQAPLWAVRSYRPNSSATSASSLLGVDPRAQCLAIVYEPGHGQEQITITAYGVTARSYPLLQSFFLTRDARPFALTQAGENCVTASFSIGPVDARCETFARIVRALGFLPSHGFGP